jgi:hypothetical protein
MTWHGFERGANHIRPTLTWVRRAVRGKHLVLVGEKEVDIGVVAEV